MGMRFTKVLGMAVSLAIVFLAVLMIFTVSAQDTTEEDAPLLFIGTVTDFEDEFVGVAIDGENVTLYICDGQPELGTVSIAQWFTGTIAGTVIDITARNGNRVQAHVGEESITGVFTFADGSTKAFALIPAEGSAALYRSEFRLGNVDFIGGWLVLADGTVRGAVFNTDTEELVPATLVGPTLPVPEEESA
jgi:hypothetical protein